MTTEDTKSGWSILEAGRDRDGNRVLSSHPVTDDEWHRRGGRIYFHGGMGDASAVAVTDIHALPGWALQMVFEIVPVDGTPAPVMNEVVLRRRDATATTGSRMLRSLGLGAAVERAEEQLRDLTVAEHFLGERWSSPIHRSRPGRRGRSDLEWALLARRYVEALETDPRRPIRTMVEAALADGDHVTEAEMRKKVARCRPRFLTRTERGSAGGELTPLAVGLLAEFDNAGGAR